MYVYFIIYIYIYTFIYITYMRRSDTCFQQWCVGAGLVAQEPRHIISDQRVWPGPSRVPREGPRERASEGISDDGAYSVET